jgi:hypothetical protein
MFDAFFFDKDIPYNIPCLYFSIRFEPASAYAFQYKRGKRGCREPTLKIVK